MAAPAASSCLLLVMSLFTNLQRNFAVKFFENRLAFDEAKGKRHFSQWLIAGILCNSIHETLI